MAIFIIALAVVFNLVILRWKFNEGRYGDMALDFLSIALLTAMFGTTLGGMMIVAIAGTIVSLYLLVFPPEFA